MKKKLNVKSLIDFLFKEIHPATLGFFRMVVGVTFLVQLDRIYEYVVVILPQCQFFLTYDLFHWVHIMPETSMALMFTGMRIAAILVLLGVLYRPAMAYLFVTWTYVLLLCNGHYNNHYYLLSLITFMMIFMAADRYLSVNQLIFYLLHRFKVGAGSVVGKLANWWHEHQFKIPNWQVFLLKAQLFIVYFYGGLAKLNKDWINGYPLKIWLPGKEFPLLEAWLWTESAAYFFSYLGILFDIGVGFLLFYKPARKWVLPFLIAFHVSNHFLWNIGVFPWFMIAATAIFFVPDFPHQIYTFIKDRLFSGKGKTTPKKSKKGATASEKRKAKQQQKAAEPVQIGAVGGFTWNRKLVVGLMGIYLMWQLLFPFRQYFYSGQVGWHGMGNDFAWRMMLIDRVYASKVIVTIPGEGAIGGVDMGKYMTGRQIKAMGHYPSHYIRFAHFLRDEMQENGLEGEPEINAYVFRSFNGRPFQPLIDTTANLVPMQAKTWQKPDCVIPFQDLPYKENPDLLTEEERKVFGM